MGSDQPSTLQLTDPAAPQSSRVACVHWVHGLRGNPTLTRFERARMVVGRSPDCDITLDAAGVSRHHAVFFHEGPACALADTASKNGIFVNGRAVTHATLAAGDVIRLGDALGVFGFVTRTAQTMGGAGERDANADSGTTGHASSEELVGEGMAAALRDLAAIATSSLPVVVFGETGVGKERVAEAIHRASGRPGLLHAVNCAAIPENLAEAELFGHKKGAFTGAESAALGHFRAADTGTLFLDELQDLPRKVQALLLRVLQGGLVYPVGETKPVAVDVRIVAASHRPLEELVSAGRLREDLAMRLAGFTILIPPLRERRLDVHALLRHFLNLYAAEHQRPLEVHVRCLEDLLLHDWPGNVRELEFLVRRLLALSGRERTLAWHMLPDAIRRKPAPAAPHSLIPAETRAARDIAALTEALRACNGNVARAAVSATISRQRAYRLMAGKSVAEFLKDPGPPLSNADANASDDD
ncbi:MAG TPA: sigma 54-interacting transcriptional regulator [Polyangiaceae bacterium]|nr:sigma 54-interacting transcriptional regulator [Polyangiaceae bacterium]